MKKNRGLKNRIAFSNAIDKGLHDALERLHKDTRIPKSRLLDEAIELLLQKHGLINKESPPSHK